MPERFHSLQFPKQQQQLTTITLLLFFFTIITAVSAINTIPINELKIKGQVIQKDDNNYSSVIYIDNGLYQKYPQIVVLPLTIGDVQETIKFSQKYNLKLSVKGGGHSAAGYCLTNEIVLDMKYFNKTRMISEGIAYIEAGLRWSTIYPSLAPNIPIAGTCPFVGVMGYTLGGGYSMLSRSYGLGSDSVIEFDMVLANGDFVKVNNESYPDLFWALRGGGGGNFGIVTSIKTRTYRTKTPEILTSNVCWTIDNMIDVIDYFNKWISNVPKEMAAYGIVLYDDKSQQDQFCLTFVYNGDYNEGYNLMKPFLSINGAQITSLEKTGFIKFITGFGGKTDIGHRNAFVKSGLIPKGKLTRQLGNVFYQFMKNRPSKDAMLIWSHIGGAIRDINTQATAFYRRDAEFVIELKAIFTKPEDYEKTRDWAESFYSAMKPNFNGSYINYIDPYLPNWEQEYYGGNYNRLLDIKKKYDPTNFFNFKQSIGSNFKAYSVKNNGKELSFKKLLKQTKEEEMIRKMLAFQDGQIQRNVTILEPLFAIDSVVNIPVGSNKVVGRDNIIKNFQSFFETLVVMKEDITKLMKSQRKVVE
ncbi:hypothetical protein ABK040_013701 [Willaertia magna]